MATSRSRSELYEAVCDRCGDRRCASKPPDGVAEDVSYWVKFTEDIGDPENKIEYHPVEWGVVRITVTAREEPHVHTETELYWLVCRKCLDEHYFF